MGFPWLPGGGGGSVCSALLLPHTPFFGAVKETENKSKTGTSQHLGKLENGFVLENSSRKTLPCPGHGWATKAMAGRELGWAGAEEEEDIPEIPDFPRAELSVLGWAVQVALGSPGVWMWLSGEFLEFWVALPPSICHLFHGCILESGWRLPLSVLWVFLLIMLLFLFIPIYFPLSNILFRAP